MVATEGSRERRDGRTPAVWDLFEDSEGPGTGRRQSGGPDSDQGGSRGGGEGNPCQGPPVGP